MPKKGRTRIGTPRRKRVADQNRITNENADGRENRLTRMRATRQLRRAPLAARNSDDPSVVEQAGNNSEDLIGARQDERNAADLNPTSANVQVDNAALNCRLAYWNGTTSINVEAHYCGELAHVCRFCEAKHFCNEKKGADGHFTLCCHNGQFELAALCDYPERLKTLITGSDEMSKHFQTCIRNYNSALAMASMGAQIIDPPGNGPYCLKISGQVYHTGSALYPNQGVQPKYAQLYVIDTQEASQIRTSLNNNCNPELMLELSDLMTRVNPYANAFRSMGEIENEHRTQYGVSLSKMAIKLVRDDSRDQRRYNLPTASEVAVVFEGEDGAPPGNRDFQVYTRLDTKTVRISILNPMLDAMLYPLLLPAGGEGWTDSLRWKNSNKRISQIEFYAFRMAIRDSFNPLHHAGKLFQQYVVDAYCKAEANRLNYIKEHQKDLRADLYSGLMDFIANQADNRGMKAGTMLILPSSFVGSPRYMRESYLDAMRMVEKYGKPDLFITMTCNPSWPEIQENLFPHQTASDRPDLVARVFKLKKQNLMDEITKSNIFGEPVAHAHSIEFQKRGLPHAHILIILYSTDKPRCRLDIDKIVSAEIPDENIDSDLRAKVLKHNIHNECKLGSRCWDGGKCTKNFPKEFSDETIENVDGYPLYRRRDTGRVRRTANTETDNRWVVPYNPYLTKRYDCHINVEICSSVKSVKYIYKYIYKGHDCALVAISPELQSTLNWDEIAQYLDCRYVCAPEAAWRIFAFNLQEKSHAIVRLAVHLENSQYTVFQSGQEMRALENTRNTTLTAWFQLNAEDPEARSLLYTEIPDHYTLQNKKWKKRKQENKPILSRMYFVSPQDGERYYLRLLLLKVKGATSFQDIRKIDGITYETFQEAAKKLGLLKDDMECHNTMEEAVLFQMPYQLRQMFGYMCIFCCPQNARQLYEDFKRQMYEDYKNNDYSDEDAEDLLLEDLQNFFVDVGKSLAYFRLPHPTRKVQRRGTTVEAPNMECYANMAEQMTATMDCAQKKIYNDVMKSVDGRSNQRLFYLDGPGGSGKTYTYNAILNKLKGSDKKSIAVAFTGVAANLLQDGATSHRAFGIPVPTLENSTSKIKPTSKKGQILRDADLILWDEASMIPKSVLECVDTLLKDITNSTLPFGGKVLLLGGDFRQCLPVVQHGGRVATVSSCIKHSALWKHFKTYKLKVNHRLQGSETLHADWLIELGNGKLTQEPGVPQDYVKVPPEMLTENVADDIFPKKIRPNEVHNFADRAILCPLNEQCDRLNIEIINRIDSESKSYLSVDTIISDEADAENLYPIEYLNSINPSCMAPHKLTLKKGCIVMLLRNLHLRMGLCNGTRLIVRDMRAHVILAEVLTGSQKGKLVFIPRIDITSNEDGLPFKLQRRQFPIKPAFCMTITKSQGQTFTKIGLYLEEPVFSHGMLYVALSRCASRDGIRIQVANTRLQGSINKDNEDIYIFNCVYREILQ